MLPGTLSILAEVGFTAPLVLKQGEEGKLARDVDLPPGAFQMLPRQQSDMLTLWYFNITMDNCHF